MADRFSDDSQAFLKNIAEDPDSDLPRLVYADWLDEQGHPQGEFIRVQCELAKLKQWNAPQRYCHLKQREAELLERYGDEFAGACRHIDFFEFRRGVVEFLPLNDRDAFEALKDCPTINTISAHDDLPRFSQELDWSRIREIKLRNGGAFGHKTRPQVFGELQQSGSLRSLRSLDMTLASQPKIEIECLSNLQNLTLSVCANDPNHNQLDQIVRKPYRQLALSVDESHVLPARTIQRIPPKRLKWLTLRGIDLSQETFDSVQSIMGATIRLEFGCGETSSQELNKFISNISRSRAASNIRELIIENSPFQEALHIAQGLKDISESEYLGKLQHLHVDGLATETAIVDLFHASNLPSLRSLHMDTEQELDGDFLSRLGNTPLVRQLNHLKFEHPGLLETKDVMRFFINAGWQPGSCRVLDCSQYSACDPLIDQYLFGSM